MEERDHRWDILFDAALKEPQKLSGIVNTDPSILEVENLAGETVLNYFALEGMVDEVKLLHKLGARIPPVAIYNAMEHGHTEMVIMLLELGADPVRAQCEKILENSLWNLTKEQKRLFRSYLDQYGYDV